MPVPGRKKYRFLPLALLLFAAFAPAAWAMPEMFSSDSRFLLPGTEIVIDAGHGGIDGGAFFGKVLEKDINLQMGKKLFAELDRLGYSVALTRTGDYALSDDNHWQKHRSRHLRDLGQRKELANQLRPKLIVSLHVNSARRTGKSGGIVLYYPKNEDSRLLAKHIQASLNAVYRQRGIPAARKNLYLLKRAESPAVIVEMGFISNAGDRLRLTDEAGQNELAAEIAAAIHGYLKGTPAPNDNPGSPAPAPSGSP